MGQTLFAVICMIIAVIAGIWGFMLDHSSGKKNDRQTDDSTTKDTQNLNKQE